MSGHPRVNPNSRRQQSRKYYAVGKRPQAFFMLANQLCRGEIIDRSTTGLALQIPAEIIPPEESIIKIQRLYIYDCQPEFLLENLTVRYLAPVESQPAGRKYWRIGLAVDDKSAAERLQQVFEQWYMPASQNGEESKVPDNLDTSLDCRRIPYNPEEDQYDEQSIQRRRRWLEAVSGVSLQHLPQYSFSARLLAGNIENFIGCAQIPVGLAGPVHVKGHYVERLIPLPIATTEGALVSSISRGAHICNLAGGIKTAVLRQTMVRAPIFRFQDMEGALNFIHWLRSRQSEICRIAESNSNVARVERLEPFIFGQAVHLRFYYTTGDAAGQNMTTACTYLACEWIKKQIEDDSSIRFLSYLIDGNLSGDKKANMQNFMMGRGVAVLAECLIPDHLLRKYLRISAKEMAKGWQDSTVAAAQIGMMGANCNFANVIAGIFTATGQDIASVHESSAGILQLKEHEDGLYVSVYLPALVIGTVGGGTGLPTQNECLQIMGCAGRQRVLRLAEIIAAACLSLEISTTGAIAAGEFVQAHEKLGRNRQSNTLKVSDLNHSFIQTLWHGSGQITEAKFRELNHSTGLTSSVMQDERRQAQGLFQVDVLEKKQEEIIEQRLVLKLKADSSELVKMGIRLAALSGNDRLPGLISAYHEVFGFQNSEQREVQIYEKLNAHLEKFMPKIYGTRLDLENGIQAVLMEDLSESMKGHRLVNWEKAEIFQAIDALAEMHSIFFDKFAMLPEAMLIEQFSSDKLLSAKSLLEELTLFNQERFPDLISDKLALATRQQLQQLDQLVQSFESFPKTLIHNDFNPRNLCWKKVDANSTRLIAYDWELACVHNPHYDLLELLIYSMPDAVSDEQIQSFIEHYFASLGNYVGQTWELQHFNEVLKANLYLYILVRGNLHLLAHNYQYCDYIPKVYANVHRLLNYFEACEKI